MFRGELREMPSDKTTQGELPRELTTKKASPTPKIDKPKSRINNRCRW